MRVLTVGNLYPPHGSGGYEVVWEGLVAALRARGHEVEVLTTDRVLDGARPERDREVRRVLRWYWRDHAWIAAGPVRALGIEGHNALMLARALRAFRPDVAVFLSMGGLSLSLVTRTARAGVGCVGVVHDGWPVYGPRVDRFNAGVGRFARVRWDPARVGAWSANSRFVADRALVGVDPRRVSVDPPGVDPVRFAAAAVTDWGWRLAVVGRVEERKGVAHAIAALAALGSEATLLVAGPADPGHLAELRALAVRLGVAARVTFAGEVADVRGAYAAADAVLFGVTWEEPFGLVPLEAMAVGRPVVATGTGGSAEYLRDGENCLLAPPRDAGALAAAVRRLAAEPALRERLRAGGAATAARFTPSTFHDAIEALCLRLAAGAESVRR